MIKDLFCFATVLLIISCSSKNETEKILSLEWKDGEKVIFENGKFHSFTHFDNNLKKMVGDSMIPMVITDSTIIVTHINSYSNYKQGLTESQKESNSVFKDTLRFEIRNFNGPKLLLYSLKDTYPLVYNLEKDNIQNLNEIKIFDNIRFEMNGLSIGDKINRLELDFKRVNNNTNYNSEDAKLKTNKDLDLEIIGDNYIYRITQRNISKYDLEDVIKVVSSKLNQEAKHSPTERAYGDNEIEFYSWDKNGVSITLQRFTYVGDDVHRKKYADYSWSLSYEDEIMQGILESQFRKGKPKSLIIK